MLAQLDVIEYVDPVTNVVPVLVDGAHDALTAIDELTEYEAEIELLDVIGYVEPVFRVVPDPPPFKANEAVTELDDVTEYDALNALLAVI